MTTLERIIAEVQTLAPELQEEVLEYIRFLRVRRNVKRFVPTLRGIPVFLEWESPEEEAAWAYLQDDADADNAISGIKK